MNPETLGQLISEDIDDHPPGIAVVIDGSVKLGEEDESVRLTCAGCLRAGGPWLMSTWDSLVVATCLCGRHASHPRITIAKLVNACPPATDGPGLPMFTGTLDELAELRGFNGGSGLDKITGQTWHPLG